uniref:Uncharacterized protein n=1 Tax=Romanomermis culicivorax TaxID=13658 RepID=A0A915J2G7_ROMCU
MTTPSTSSASAADEPPPYRESINVNEHYVGWAEQQPHQNDLSFACDVVGPTTPQPAAALTSAYDNSPYLAIVARSSCQDAPVEVTSPPKPLLP